MRNVCSWYCPLLFFASKCGYYLSSLKRYGFRKPPHIELKARPKLGEREVTLVHVTDWIEKKLEQEFQVHLQCHLVFHAEALKALGRTEVLNFMWVRILLGKSGESYGPQESTHMIK